MQRLYSLLCACDLNFKRPLQFPQIWVHFLSHKEFLMKAILQYGIRTAKLSHIQKGPLMKILILYS